MKKTAVLVLAMALVLFMSMAVIAQEANEWSQFQKNESNEGFIDILMPVPAGAGGREVTARYMTDVMDARAGSQPVVSGSRAYVYTGVDDTSGSLVCLDIVTGQKVWEREIDPPTFGSRSSPAVAGGVAYIGSGSKVYAFNALDGVTVWVKDLRSLKPNAMIVNSSPTVAGDRLYIGDYNNGIYYCLDATDGGGLWLFSLDPDCIAQATTAVSGDRVFVGQSVAFGFAPNGKVWCLDRDTGQPVTSWGNNGYFKTDDDLDVLGSVAVSGDYIYFTDYDFYSPDSHIYCVNKNDGSLSWKATVLPSSGAPSVGEGIAVTCGTDWGAGINRTTAFSTGSGAGGAATPLWSRDGIGGWTMTGSIADGKVAVGNDNGADSGVFVLDAGDGDTLWESDQGQYSPVPTAYGLLSINDTGELVTIGSETKANGDFYFAEGCTREGYQEWICLENPGGEKVTANIEYMMSDGATSDQPVELPPKSRTTVDVNAFVGPGCDVAAHVTGDGYFVAERAMYINNAGISGGEQVVGVSNPPAKQYLFAEGTTRDGFQTWLALQNPGDDEVSVLVTYVYSGKEPKAESHTVPASSRKTIDVNTNAGAGEDVSISVTSSRQIVAERVMYFDRPGAILGAQPVGVHNSTGARSSGTQWYFAEGTTRYNFQEWLCLMNPRGSETTATVEYVMMDGTTAALEKVLPANSRTTVDVNSDVGEGKDLSIYVSSDDPIVVERPVYFQYFPGTVPGSWGGGHNTMGSAHADYTWEFAEGTTRGGFETYLCVLNPNSQDVEITVEYITFVDGLNETLTETVTVPATTRHTIRVNDIVGAGKDVSMNVTSQVPIVVERPMYFSTSGYVGGGTALGL